MIRKSCPEHGVFEDVYWSDAELYRRFQRYLENGSGIENFITRGDCPFSCGLCERHKTSTLLANIDLTTRCNLACPICFADASPKKIYEPTLEQIRACSSSSGRRSPCLATLSSSQVESRLFAMISQR